MIENLKIGPGLEKSSEMGPLVTKQHLDKVKNYIDIGEDELDVSKLSTVIRAKYGSISAAQEKLGTAQNIQKTFIDFQQYLYQEIRV